MDAIVPLCEHVAARDWRDLPAEAVSAAKTYILDSLGVAVAGSAGPRAGELAALQSLWGERGDAHVIVHGHHLPAPAAALCNAYQLHNAEFDCLHEGAVVHPMACVLPAALAYAERAGSISGQDFLRAIILGVDVACHIGIGAQAGFRFFRPANAGAFGATAAVGRLMNLDAATLQHAMGITLGQLSGTMQPHIEGSPLLAMQIGFSARNAIVGCDMARDGFTGPRNVLEGPYGYFPLFEPDHDAAATIAEIGKIWRITEVSHKPFPSGRATHGIVDGVLRLRRQNGFGAEEISTVVARVPPLILQLVGRPTTAATSVNYARLCAQFVTARALLTDNVDLSDFQTEALRDRRTLEHAKRIFLEPDGNPDSNALTPIAVEITLHDGQVFRASIESVYGSPADPLTEDAHLTKFQANWRAAARSLPPANADRLIDRVANLDALSDICELTSLLIP